MIDFTEIKQYSKEDLANRRKHLINRKKSNKQLIKILSKKLENETIEENKLQYQFQINTLKSQIAWDVWFNFIVNAYNNFKTLGIELDKDLLRNKFNSIDSFDLFQKPFYEEPILCSKYHYKYR